MSKPEVDFFRKLIAVSRHRPDEILYVGDRLDNDISPAIKAGLATAWLRRGPWGFFLDQTLAKSIVGSVVRPSLEVDSLTRLPIIL